MAFTDLDMLFVGGTLPEVCKLTKTFNAMERRYANEESNLGRGLEVRKRFLTL